MEKKVEASFLLRVWCLEGCMWVSSGEYMKGIRGYD